jgi:hypothetical protein
MIVPILQGLALPFAVLLIHGIFCRRWREPFLPVSSRSRASVYRGRSANWR